MKYLKNYIQQIRETTSIIDYNKLQNIEKIIYSKILNNKKIFICGNGGSASISNHFLCDFNKGIMITSGYKLKPKISTKKFSYKSRRFYFKFIISK
jgi:D-sedoheptulose 7-phosphate isomerase